MKSEAERAAARRRAREQFDRAYGGEASSSTDAPSAHDAYSIEKQARDEWERSPAIRAEFGELERYLAFKRAEAKGLVRIH